jgi:hypothetical protein
MQARHIAILGTAGVSQAIERATAGGEPAAEAGEVSAGPARREQDLIINL